MHPIYPLFSQKCRTIPVKMFHKSFVLASENKVSGKDRKKLRANLQRLFPRLNEDDLERVFPLKDGECNTARLKAPHRGHLYLLNGLPMLLDLDGKGDFVPCLNLLWEVPTLLPLILLKHQDVSSFILGGADLMLPGAKQPFDDGFLRGTLVSIRVPGNPLPFAIGRAAMSAVEARQNSSGKGKLVEIIQSYGDLMSKHFSGMKPPNEGFSNHLISAVEAESETFESKEQESFEELPNEEFQPSDITETESHAVVEEDMDVLLEKCFLQALRKSVRNTDLPLPAGALWINHMIPNKIPGIHLDIKRTTYKKLSKFLQKFSEGEQPLLTLKVEKFSRETVITEINREHEVYTSFQPYVMDTSITEATTELSKSQELKIEEVYRIGKEWNDVLRVLGLEPNCVLAKNRATELPFSYVQQAGLDQGVPDRKHIVLDKILGDALFQGALKRNERIPEYLPKAQLSNIALNRMHRQYCITRGTQQALKKGTMPHVQIREVKRTGNKFATTISGIETFLVDPSELATMLQKRFACSTSLHEAFHKGVKEHVIHLQGRKVKEIAALLKETYGIPEQFIQM